MFYLIFLLKKEYPMVAPFIAGIWCGESKPPCKEYLKPFISEMKELLVNGLNIDLTHINVKFGFCISDTPARALIKGKRHEHIPIFLNLCIMIYTHVYKQIL